jgi:mannose-6-phosphate isomerase-like protein (cupin superfamily)
MRTMPHHTVVNLKRVEDAAQKFGMPPGLEAHFARTPLGLEKSGVTLFKADAGFKIPWGHTHREQEEIYLVIAGSATVQFEDGSVELGEWDAVRIPPDVPRSFEAGPDGTELLAFGAGPKGDAELIQDFW